MLEGSERQRLNKFAKEIGRVKIKKSQQENSFFKMHQSSVYSESMTSQRDLKNV